MSRQKIYDIILARTLNNGIGLNNTLPWKLPKDLKMFKKITTNSKHLNSIIMGYNTFQSLNFKPLSNRLNIIVSKNHKIDENDYLKQSQDLQSALNISEQYSPNGCKYVIGGSKLFESAFNNCRYIYETLINKNILCDTYISNINNYQCCYISKSQVENNINYDYRLYYNTQKYNKPIENLFNLPEHQQYQYLKIIRNIIENGQNKIDRTKTGTKSIFGGMMKYDLSQTFPLLTHKKIFWRAVAQQLLWFIKGSTNASQLQQKKIHIWDGNSSKQYLNSLGIDRQAGDLGPIYGFQWRFWNAKYIDRNQNYLGQGIDQLAWIINQIQNNPNSRRLIMSAWNPSQLNEMALPPCHLLCQFYVTNDNRLNCILYQRSCDMGLGVPFNIASYSLLTCLIAQVTNLKRGQFIHMMGDMHIYTDHINSLKNIHSLELYPFPILQIDSNINQIDDFKIEHLKIINYKSHSKINMKMSV